MTNLELFKAGLPALVRLNAKSYAKWQQYVVIDEVTSKNIAFHKKMQAFWGRWCEKVEKGCLFVKQRAKKHKRHRLSTDIITPNEIDIVWIKFVDADGVFWVKCFTATAFLVTEENINTLNSLVIRDKIKPLEVGWVVVVDNGDEFGFCLDTFLCEADFYEKYFIPSIPIA